MFNNKSGFTLIELLIVVAIVGILAAIAIPNFLMAQTRAKVSRAQSDMRVIAGALSTYRVDHNRLPDSWPAGVNRYDFLSRMQALSTPVDYLTSLPEDPFNHWYTTGTVYHNLSEMDGGTAYCYGRGDKAGPYGTLDLGQVYMMLAGAGPDNTLGQVHYYPGTQKHGLGPADCPICDPVLADLLRVTVYDPTNGTISDGDIYRWSLFQQHVDSE